MVQQGYVSRGRMQNARLWDSVAEAEGINVTRVLSVLLPHLGPRTCSLPLQRCRSADTHRAVG